MKGKEKEKEIQSKDTDDATKIVKEKKRISPAHLECDFHHTINQLVQLPEAQWPRLIRLRGMHSKIHTLMTRLEARARQGTSISTRDRYGFISLLARRSRNVFLWFRGRCGLEAVLLHRGGGVLNADGRRLKREWFRLGEGGLSLLCVLRSVVFAVLSFADGIVVEVGGKRGGHWCLLEAGGVGRGLGAQLGEVEV